MNAFIVIIARTITEGSICLCKEEEGIWVRGAVVETFPSSDSDSVEGSVSIELETSRILKTFGISDIFPDASGGNAYPFPVIVGISLNRTPQKKTFRLRVKRSLTKKKRRSQQLSVMTATLIAHLIQRGTLQFNK